jgi:hypothetical protein
METEVAERSKTVRNVRCALRAVVAAGVLVLCPGLKAAPAAEVSGVTLPETVTVGSEDGRVLLNGAGVRKKLFVKVYVGALYLNEKVHSAEEVLDNSGPKRIVMHFLYKELGSEKLVQAWEDGFSANQGAAAMEALRDRLEKFNGLFPAVHSGDAIELDILPGKGTVVSLNGAERGVVEGEDFSRALLEVWLGAKPADKGLKKALLGK